MQILRALFFRKAPLTSPPSPAIPLEIIWAGEACFPLVGHDWCERTSALLFVPALNGTLINPQKKQLFQIKGLKARGCTGSVQLLACSSEGPHRENPGSALFREPKLKG